MPRYVWEGRTRSGSQARGVIEAPAREAALRQVQSSGVLVTRLEQSSAGAAEPAPPSFPSETPTAPPPQRRPGESLRDKLFYIGVALVFTLLGLGTAAVFPVLRYDCDRDGHGAVQCTVHRRMYGLLPLPDWKLARVLSAGVETSSTHRSTIRGEREQGSSKLVLACSDGTRWKSPSSSWPLGQSNDDLATGIRDLLAAGSPTEFHAWQGEKVALLVGTVFLLPAGLMLLALLLRIVVGSAWVEREVTKLERPAQR